MDIDLNKLNALFLPYDLSHLLVVWSVLTAFLLIFGTIISATGIYSNARHFWKMQLAVLGGVYLVSAASFLLMHLNAVGVMIVLLTLALVILGRVGVREEIGPLEDWWLFRLWEREQSSQDQDQ